MKKIKLTLRNARDLRNALRAGAQVNCVNVKFAALRNVKILNAIVDEFDQLCNGRGPLAPKAVGAYQTDLQKLRDEYGLNRGHSLAADKVPEFQNRVKQIQDEHRDALEQVDTEILKLSDEPISTTLATFQESWFTDATPGHLIEAILEYDLLKEGGEE